MQNFWRMYNSVLFVACGFYVLYNHTTFHPYQIVATILFVGSSILASQQRSV